MVLESDLNNWNNGNFSDLDRNALMRIAKYFEYVAEHRHLAANDLIIDDTAEE